jgi:hypothetical protein
METQQPQIMHSRFHSPTSRARPKYCQWFRSVITRLRKNGPHETTTKNLIRPQVARLGFQLMKCAPILDSQVPALPSGSKPLVRGPSRVYGPVGIRINDYASPRLVWKLLLIQAFSTARMAHCEGFKSPLGLVDPDRSIHDAKRSPEKQHDHVSTRTGGAWQAGKPESDSLAGTQSLPSTQQFAASRNFQGPRTSPLSCPEGFLTGALRFDELSYPSNCVARRSEPTPARCGTGVTRES